MAGWPWRLRRCGRLRNAADKTTLRLCIVLRDLTLLAARARDRCQVTELVDAPNQAVSAQRHERLLACDHVACVKAVLRWRLVDIDAAGFRAA